MSVFLHTTGPGPCLHPRSRVTPPHPSCLTKVYVGLRHQSPGSFGAGKPNLNVEFHTKVYNSICLGAVSKPTRGCMVNMPIGVPRVPYRNPGERTWQWVDLWNALYRERIVFLGQPIDDEFCNTILTTLLYLDSIDSTSPLYLYINGEGGDITPCMAVHDTLKSLASPIGTHCMGCAYDLSALLLAAGKKGIRSSMTHSVMALQPPAGAARGQADDIRNETNELLRIKDYIFSELSKHTGQPLEQIHKDLKRKKRFSAPQAVEYGIIDKIVRPARFKGATPDDGGTGLGW